MARAIVPVAGLALLIAGFNPGCAARTPPPEAPVAAPAVAPEPAAPAIPPAPPRAGVPRFAGTGKWTRAITTIEPEAQAYFDQGLAFLFAFNHDEALRSFREAQAIDPASAMAAWGEALANGPHINFPMVPEERAKAAWEALGRARALAGGASPVERELIEALSARHAWPQPEDRRPLDEAYAKAMGEVWRRHPKDADVGALHAEALMDLRPWDLWTADGKEQPGTAEVVATLEAVLALAPDHPLANHLYIHAVEASPDPARADAAAERLRGLSPGLGHLVHMPTHIDVRRGRWAKAARSNEQAIEADAAYRAASGKEQGFYRIYMAHNHHMLSFAAMMSGRGEAAIAAIRAMVGSMPEAFVKENAPVIDGFFGMPFEVLMRFGRWDAILDEPEPADYLPVARAMRRYARGVARAAKGDAKGAREEQAAFRAARERVAKDATFGNNAAADLLAVAESVLEGEILFREGRREPALAALREAVEREDGLRYDEPPDWIQPARHALGAALLHAKKPGAKDLAEAEAVYRADLEKLPENVWALQGLARTLKLAKKKAAIPGVEARLKEAASEADVVLTSSCMCLPGI